MKVVDGILEGRDTLEEVEGGGGGFTTGVNALEEGEGGGSTGRKIMPVAFCFFGASLGHPNLLHLNQTQRTSQGSPSKEEALPDLPESRKI